MKSAILIFLAVSLNAWNLFGYEMAVSITNTSLVYGQHQEYISDDFVDTYGYVNVYSGAKLRLWARDRVTLNPGFHAGSGSDFRAAVDANLDGISDMDEGVDSDGDGISDTLERSVGQDPFNATDSYVGDINGDGIFDRLTDVVSLDQTIGLEDLGIDGLAYSGFGGDLVVEAIPCYDYLLMDDPVTFAMWFVLIDLGDTMPSFYNLYVPPAYTLVQAGISGYAVRIIWDSESGKSYQIQKREDNDDQWTNFGSVFSGTGQDIIYTSSEQWYEFDDIGNQFRVVKLGVASHLVGSPVTADVFGDTNDEVFQKATPEVTATAGATHTIEVAHGTQSGLDDVIAVIVPKGSTPTTPGVAIEILGVKIDVTASGKISFSFPTAIFGSADDWSFFVVYGDVADVLSVEFDNVWDRNLQHAQDSYPDYEKCIAVEHNASLSELDLKNYLKIEPSSLSFDDIKDHVSFNVEHQIFSTATIKNDCFLDYNGSDPDDVNIYAFGVQLLCGSSVADRLIVVVYSDETQPEHTDWIAQNVAEGTAWLNELPRVYSELGASNADPEPVQCNPQQWSWDPGVPAFYHFNATFEIRSRETAGSHGHQACYNAAGVLISPSGGLEALASSGTADWRHPDNWFLPPTHSTADVRPFLRAAQLDGNPVEGLFNMTHPLIRIGPRLQEYYNWRPAHTGSTRPHDQCIDPGACSFH